MKNANVIQLLAKNLCARKDDPITGNEIRQSYEFPLEDVIASIKDRALQNRQFAELDVEDYRGRLEDKVVLAPKEYCWVYFQSPPWTWETLCGRAGWMVIDVQICKQKAFFLEIMN
jgi:hypothetical protein